jgi:hypothetical protein
MTLEACGYPDSGEGVWRVRGGGRRVGTFGETIAYHVHATPPPVSWGTCGAPPRNRRLRSVGQGFALSLANGRGGETSPITAAEWFAVHGGVWSDVPTTGWHVVGSPGLTTDVESGSVTLQVLQGSDCTWQVVSGSEPAC